MTDDIEFVFSLVYKFLGDLDDADLDRVQNAEGQIREAFRIADYWEWEDWRR